jgi:hypothetical protein
VRVSASILAGGKRFQPGSWLVSLAVPSAGKSGSDAIDPLKNRVLEPSENGLIDKFTIK